MIRRKAVLPLSERTEYFVAPLTDHRFSQVLAYESASFSCSKDCERVLVSAVGHASISAIKHPRAGSLAP